MSNHPLETENRRLRAALEEAETAARKRIATCIVYDAVWETACLIADEIASIRRRAAEPASGDALQRLQELADERSLVQSICLKGLAAEPASGEATHGSPELDADAAKLAAMGADPGPTFAELLAPPPPPTQGEEETAHKIARTVFTSNDEADFGPFHDLVDFIASALRQRADEATRTEREACAALQIGSGAPATNESASVFASGFRCALGMYRDAIRVRITPGGEP